MRSNDLGESRALPALLLVGLLLATVLRTAFLSADHTYYAWAGHVTDEGRWTQQARELVLFGSLDLRGRLALAHFVLAPLFQAATWASFSVLGVGLAAARVVSAVSGVLLLIAMWWLLRRRLSTHGLLLSLACVAFQRDLVFLSRAAIPEMAAMLFELVTFAILVTEPRSIRRAALAGLVMAIGLGFKATGLYVIPALVAATVVTHEKEDAESWGRRVAAFLAMVAASAVLVSLAAAAVPDTDIVGRFVATVPSLTDLVRPASLFGAATLLFYGVHTVSLNVLLLGAWIIGGLLAAGGRIPRGPARTLYLGSGAWWISWLFVAAVIDYFPERYIFHCLVPLAMHLGSGLTLLRASDADVMRASLAGPLRLRRLAVHGWLSLPLAVVLCPVAVNLLGAAEVPFARFTHQALLIGVLALCVVGVTSTVARPGTRLFILCVFPLLLTTGWLLATAGGLIEDAFWAPASTAAQTATLLALPPATLLLAWALLARAERHGGGLAGLVVATVATVLLTQTVAGFERPTYTLSQTARAIERTLADEPVVWSSSAAAVLLPTHLEYRELGLDGEPEILVDMFGLPSRLASRYEPDERYDVDLGTAYLRRHPRDGVVTVYRHRP